MSFQIITKLKRTIFLFVFCTFPVLFYSQGQQQHSSKVLYAIETYAYLKGQTAALKAVANQFPSLRPKVTRAENNSEISFAKAQRNIEQFLQEELTGSEFDMLQQRIDSLILEKLKNPIENERYAIDFIEKVSKGPRFISDPLVSKGILSFVYHDVPHQEINDGHSITFTTKDHPKADQTNLKITIPKSWLAEEAHMPETVQQFTSHYGKGSEKIVIVVYDLPDGQHEIALNEKSILEMIPPESELIRTDNIKIDGIPGMMVEVEQPVYIADNQMKIRMMQFMFTQKQKLYCLQGSIGPVETDKNLDYQIKKYEPLFRLIASKAELDN